LGRASDNAIYLLDRAPSTCITLERFWPPGFAIRKQTRLDKFTQFPDMLLSNEPYIVVFKQFSLTNPTPSDDNTIVVPFGLKNTGSGFAETGFFSMTFKPRDHLSLTGPLHALQAFT
jgi:hypothetical protein